MKKKFILLLFILMAVGIIFGSSNCFATSFDVPDIWTPFVQTVDGQVQDFYCIQKGTPIHMNSVKQANTYGGWTDYVGAAPTSEKINETTVYTKTGTNELPKWLSYVLTSEASNDKKLIQYVIWLSELNHGMSIVPGADYEGISGQTILGMYKQGLQYQDFYNKLQKSGGYSNLISNNTDESKLKVAVDTQEGTYMVGPYNISYPNEHFASAYNGQEVYLDWIDKMYLIDQNGNKIENIEIIADSKTGNNPSSGANFYIKFKNVDAQTAKGVKLHVDFKYIQDSTGTYDTYDGSGNILEWQLKSSDASTQVWNSITKKYELERHTYYWYEAIKVGTYNAQQLITPIVKEIVSTAGVVSQRLIGEASLEINQYKPLTMILTGIVFVDKPSGKESIKNGIIDIGANAVDAPLEGVEIRLYEQNGNLAAICSNKDENPSSTQVEIRTNPTITNANGLYEFKGLDPMKKYYVEFIYNGQTYKNVQYMVGGNEYNSNAWALNSKATEGTNNRTNFNNIFAEIGSTPKNYKSSNSLGYGLEYNIAYTESEIAKIKQTILEKTKQYINANNKYPDLKNDIYAKILEQSNNYETKSKLQYIEDAKIGAYTGSNGKDKIDLYPIPTKFVISTEAIDGYTALYNGQRFVNLGLDRRDIFDVAIRKDVYKATVVINGKTHTYEYNRRQLIDDSYWKVEVRLQDQQYYTNSYDRTIYKSDYNYGIYDGKEVSEEDKLNVYVTYKISMRNSSQIKKAAITEVVDYYDEDYTFVQDMSYVGNSSGDKTGNIQSSNSSKYGQDSEYTISGYNKIYLTGVENTKLSAGEKEYMYITFRVNKDQNGAVLIDENGKGEIGTGKENIVEINGYKSYEQNGEIAGVIDDNSKPGNITSSDITKFEDDTDKAPNTKIIFYRDEQGNIITRKVNGTTWEEDRNLSVAGANIGNGIIEEKEKKVSDITVQLVELRKDGTERIWNETSTNVNGYYSFENYIPGDYTVRFLYGNKKENIEYNGLKYKSTIYQEGLNTYNDQNETRTYTYDISAADTKTNISDAKDILSRRKEVTNNFATVNNHLAMVANAYNGTDEALINELIEKAWMRAETGTINVELEYNRNATSYGQNTDYILNNINLGLVKRPEANMKVSKDVERVKVYLANDKVEIDTNESMSNVQWSKPTSTENGFVNIIMDKELMHGARIEITYKITVENTGEVDYLSNSFYYKGIVNKNDSKATLQVNMLADYVDNSIIYRQDDNENWTISSKENLQNKENLISSNINLADINTIITTEKLNTKLEPGQKANTNLILSKTISTENDNGDLSYDNIIEVLKTTSSNGTVTYNSLVGNQNPEEKAREQDSDNAEMVSILPPLGEQPIYYVIISISAVILIFGIVIIKKKVL